MTETYLDRCKAALEKAKTDFKRTRAKDDLEDMKFYRECIKEEEYRILNPGKKKWK